MEESNGNNNFELTGYDGRLAKLETIVENLAGSIGRLTEDVSEMAKFTRSRTQTNWSTIFAGTSLVVTLVVALVAGYVGLPLSHFKSQFVTFQADVEKRFENEAENAESERKHNMRWATEKVKALDDRDARLYENTQTELGRLRNWQEKIQEAHLPTMVRIEDRVERLSDQHDVYHSELQALAARAGKLEGQVQSIERETFPQMAITTAE